MDKLISADALLKTMREAKEWSDKHGGDKYSESFRNDSGEISVEWWCVEDMVDNAETVEAIPVDWIEAKIKRLKEMNNGFSCLAADILHGVLIDWRREQEGN